MVKYITILIVAFTFVVSLGLIAYMNARITPNVTTISPWTKSEPVADEISYGEITPLTEEEFIELQRLACYTLISEATKEGKLDWERYTIILGAIRLPAYRTAWEDKMVFYYPPKNLVVRQNEMSRLQITVDEEFLTTVKESMKEK